MFTGIIQTIGTLTDIQTQEVDSRLTIQAQDLDLTTVNLGDSIAVNGVCLTVVTKTKATFTVDVSKETLDCTTLQNATVGQSVNLEKALTLQTPLGGHLVLGHVDGVGEVVKLAPDGRSIRIDIQYPENLKPYIAPKGCICVDGVSLTVNTVDDQCFSVNVIPHTAKQTTLPFWDNGSQVNIEVDMVARYLQRLALTTS